MPQEGIITLEEVRIIFRNFAGAEGRYNREGERNFGVILPEELVEQLLADGWNVKYLKPREEDGDDAEPTPWLPVDVGFGGKGRPPQIFIVNSRGKRTRLGEDEVEMLDWVDIAQNPETEKPLVDVMIRPYHWDVNGNKGIKPYLHSLYVTIVEDPLQAKYAALEEENQG